MNKKWFKSSVSMIMASLIVASGATVLTAGAIEAANTNVSAAAVDSADLTIASFYANSTSCYYRVGSQIKFYGDIQNATLYRDSYKSAYIYIQKDGNTVATLNYNRGNQRRDTWTPSEEGYYTAKLVVVDWSDNQAEETTSFTVIRSYIKSFKASASKVKLGEYVTFDAEPVNAAMRYGAFSKYDIIIEKDGKVVKTLSDVHCDPENLKFYPSQSGTYKATLDMKDFYGYQFAKVSTTFEAYTKGLEIKNFNAASSSVIKRVNSSLTLDADIEGAKLYKDSYKFADIYVYFNGEQVAKLDYQRGAMRRNRFTPTVAGTYTAKIVVCDWYDNSGEATMTFDVVESRVATFYTSTSTPYINQPVTFGYVLDNAGMKYGMYSSFKIEIQKDGKTVETIDDQHAQPENLKFQTNVAGQYKAVLKVKDFYGFEFPEATTYFTVLNPQITSFTVTAPSPIVNKEATFKSVIKDARMRYGMYSKYEIVIKKDNKVVTTLSDQHAGDLKWTPKTTGKYTATLNVTDFFGYKLASKTISFTVVNPLSISNVSASKTKMTVGQSITAEATASNGAGSYKYACYYKKTSDLSWKTLVDYGTAKKFTFKPTEAGTYNVMILVKDANGSSASKFTTITVSPALVNTSKVSTTSMKVNSKVTVNANSTGGSGNTTYLIQYKTSTASKWTTYQNYSTNKKVSLKLGQVATYSIKVTAKDSNGKTTAKTFTVKVTK